MGKYVPRKTINLNPNPLSYSPSPKCYSDSFSWKEIAPLAFEIEDHKIKTEKIATVKIKSHGTALLPFLVVTFQLIWLSGHAEASPILWYFHPSCWIALVCMMSVKGGEFLQIFYTRWMEQKNYIHKMLGIKALLYSKKEYSSQTFIVMMVYWCDNKALADARCMEHTWSTPICMNQ